MNILSEQQYHNLYGKNILNHSNAIKKSREECVFWKDTIEVILQFEVEIGRTYTLIHYVKGYDEEWCICLNYDTETQSWAAGTYCYSLESALTNCLIKMNSKFVKGDHQCRLEREYGLTYERLDEIASYMISNAIENSMYDDNLDVINEDLDFTDKEKEYYDLPEETDEEYEDYYEDYVEELEERQHKSGFYAFQDTMEMRRREK